jgi:hypothetical protein
VAPYRQRRFLLNRDEYPVVLSQGERALRNILIVINRQSLERMLQGKQSKKLMAVVELERVFNGEY